MSCHEEWPILEFPTLKPSILSRFSTGAGESVCEVLIREIVENVDRPSLVSQRISIENDQELEWIMQFINHSFNLPFHSDSTYQTLNSAVRIYLAWMTSLTAEPHKCCPLPLKNCPDRYFRKMIEAFRSIFIPKTLPSTSDTEMALCRQGNEIRTILTAIRHLTSAVVDDFEDEVWSRSLLFLLAVIDQLLSETKARDEIGCLMSGDMCHTLFDCWVKAAILEFIPSSSYWRTLSVLSWKWIPHVPVVEWWARKLLRLTVLVVQNLYGINYCSVQLNDQNLLESFKIKANDKNLQDVWLNMFQLLGNPAHFLRHSEALLECLPLDATNLAYFNGRSSLSFFLSVLAFVKMIDIFFGDSNVLLDFHECDELQYQWSESLLTLRDDKGQPNASLRSSNLSSSTSNYVSSNFFVDLNHYHSNQNIQQQINQQQNGDSSQQLMNRRSVINFPSAPDHPSQLNHGISVKNLAINSNNQDFKASLCNVAQSTDPSTISSHPSAGQFVFYILKSNRPTVFPVGSLEKRPRSSSMLSIFMEWLFDAATIPLNTRSLHKCSEDVQSEKSLHIDSVPSNEMGQLNLQSSSQNQQPIGTAFISERVPQQQTPLSIGQTYGRSSTLDEVISLSNMPNDETNRRSFATHSTSSSDISSMQAQVSGNNQANLYNSMTNTSEPNAIFNLPSVDGVVAGRAAAIGALCRIICAKSSTEKIPDDQLAHFYLVMHEAFIERDRLILCSLIYYSVDLFKLGLPGVEILLPNYLTTLDIILTESMKLRLHPSISETEMRNACLRALSTIIAWPTTFGTKRVISDELISQNIGRSKLLRSLSNNVLESSVTYLQLRKKIMRILLYMLRNETDVTNLQLTLENVRYDICQQEEEMNNNTRLKKFSEDDDEDSGKFFAISVLRSMVSAVCDNLCKPHWANDLVSCLAALDCLNCLATLPNSVLFYKGELSTGLLIVTSLCRFVDNQLQKPPMHHSRDLHSSIVTAYFTLANWILCAPMLTEIESCLSTLAQIIEFGMTGGKALEPNFYKPASQRVYDAAEYVLDSLFSSNDKFVKNIKLRNKSLQLNNEVRLMQKFGRDIVEINNFKYFLIGENSIIALHEAQHIYSISSGLPTVLAVIRTPFRDAHACYFQLRSKAVLNDDLTGNNEGDINNAKNAQSPSTVSIQSNQSLSTPQDQQQKIQKSVSAIGVNESFDNSEPIKQFTFPPGIHKVSCKLDAEFRPLESIPEVQTIQDKLERIHVELKNGSAGSEIRDKRNVWIQSSLGAILSQPPKPEDAMKKCDSIRIFLYDLGLINSSTLGNEFVPLNYENNRDLFNESLHSIVDRTPVRLTETVSIFYVRSGQRTSSSILQNCENLESTSTEFCNLLRNLGRGVDLSSGFSHWTGHWRSAFSKSSINEDLKVNAEQNRYILDGTKNFLFWQNSQVDVAFITPTTQTNPVQRTSCCSISSQQVPQANSQTSPTKSELSKNMEEKSLKALSIESNEVTEQALQKNKVLSENNFEDLANASSNKTLLVENSYAESSNNDKWKNSFAASLSSLFSLTGLNSGIKQTNDFTKSIKQSNDNRKIREETNANAINNEEYTNKEELKNYTVCQQSDTLLTRTRGKFLEKSFDEISALDIEYQENALQRKEGSSADVYNQQDFKRFTDLPDSVLKPISEAEESDSDEISPIISCSKKSIKSPFTQCETVLPKAAVSSNTETNLIDDENKNRHQWKKLAISSSSLSKIVSQNSLLASTASFDSIDSMVNFSDTSSVPAYATTILKAGTAGKPSMSMVQATSIVVKSARFSRRRGERNLANQNTPSSPVHLDGKTQDRITFSTSISTSFDSTDSNNELNNESRREMCAQVKPSTSGEDVNNCSTTENKVIAYSPLSSTPIEFPITTAQQPLPSIKRADYDEEINFPIAEIKASSNIHLENLKKLPFGARTARRKSLAKCQSIISDDSFLPKNSKSLSFLDEPFNSNSEMVIKAKPHSPKALFNRRRSSSALLLITPPTDSFSKFSKSKSKSRESILTERSNSIATSLTKTEEKVLINATSKKENESDESSNTFSFEKEKIQFTSPQSILSSQPPLSSLSYIKSFFKRRTYSTQPNEVNESVSSNNQGGMFSHLKKLSISSGPLSWYSGTEENVLEGQKSTGDNLKFLKNKMKTEDKCTEQDTPCQSHSEINISKCNLKSDEASILTAENAEKSKSQSNECVVNAPSVTDNVDTSTNMKNLRVSDVSSSMGDSFGQISGLPPIGGPKSSAWSNWPNTTNSTNSDQNGVPAFCDKVTKRSPDLRIIVVWLERIEDMYHFPFDELVPYTDDGSNTAFSRRFSSQANVQLQQSMRTDFMVVYLNCIEPGLIRVYTESVWTKKYGQPVPLIDGMVVPSKVLASLLQQTVCSIARRKMTEVENYQMNHIKRRQSILEFSRKFTTKVSFAEFIQQLIH